MPTLKQAPTAAQNIELGVERRKAILSFVRQYTKAYGYAPSHSEIGKAVGLASKSAVKRHVDILIANGKLVQTPGVYRSLRIAPRRRAS